MKEISEMYVVMKMADFADLTTIWRNFVDEIDRWDEIWDSLEILSNVANLTKLREASWQNSTGG